MHQGRRTVSYSATSTLASFRCAATSPLTCFLCMYSVALSAATTAYATNTGLQSTSCPRMLNSHAISARSFSRIASAPSLDSSLRRSASLSETDLPACSSACTRVGCCGHPGQFSHTLHGRTDTSDTPLALRVPTLSKLSTLHNVSLLRKSKCEREARPQQWWHRCAAGLHRLSELAEAHLSTRLSGSTGTSVWPLADSSLSSLRAAAIVCTKGSMPTYRWRP